MDWLCLDSRKLGERGALIVRAWGCQNWPMKVSKGQHLKAKRKCFKCSGREAALGTNVRKLLTNACLTSVGHHVPLKINMGFAKVWRKIFFICFHV